MTRKGILLAGGTGSRLFPLTLGVSKQLMPVYDKPMVYYPLATLMLAGIKSVLVITTPADQIAFRTVIGDGSQWGMDIRFEVQPRPEGIAQALVIAEPFLAGAPSALVLGDNIFYGHGLTEALASANRQPTGATIFPHQVADPERYGVVSFDHAGRPVEIVEKPARPASNWAVTGLYFYDNRASDVARSLPPSARGEIEITDLNRWYLDRGELHAERLGRGFVWLDTGTHDALLQAANLVQATQARQGQRIACPEEIAWRQGWICSEQLAALARPLIASGYGSYLMRLLEEEAR